jgi:uncharacterized membrane protein YphA (DoxX/SURF4 family)
MAVQIVRMRDDGPSGRPEDSPTAVSARWRAAVPWLALVTRIGLAVMFFVSGWNKITDLSGTVLSVRSYEILPESVVHPFAYGLPILELVVALILLLGIGTRLGALLTAALMVIFIIAVGSSWARGLDINCGCFGGGGGHDPDPVPGYISVLVRDGLLLVAALGLARWPRSPFSLDGLLGAHPPADDHDADRD